MGDLVALLEKASKEKTRKTVDQGSKAGAKNNTTVFPGKSFNEEGDAGNFSEDPGNDEVGTSSGNKRKRVRPKKRVCHSENVTFDEATLAKMGDSELNTSGGSNQDQGAEDRPGTRKGTRQRKKSHQWMEHFFSNCLYSDEKTFIEAVVPHIKTEVNDLASYIQASGTSDPTKPAVKKQKVEGAEDDDDLETDQDLGVVFDIPASGSSNYITDSLSMVKFYNNESFAPGTEKATGRKKRKAPAKKPRKKRAKKIVLDDDLDGEEDQIGLEIEAGEGPSGDQKEGEEGADGEALHSKLHARVTKTKSGRKSKSVIRLVDENRLKKVPKKRGPKPNPFAKRKMKLSTRVITSSFDVPASSDAVPSARAEELTVEQIEMDNIKKLDEIGASVKCVRCGVWYTDQEEYKKHVSNHPVFSCPDCPAKFYLKRPLTSHRYATHLDPSYLHCKQCSFQAKTAKDLCTHSETVHFQPRPFKCEYPDCPFRGKKYSDVQRHFKQIHSTEMEFFCEKCNAGFTYKSLYMYHIERCLKKDSHLCYRCGAVFHAKYDLSNHISAVHFKIKKYKCPQCDHRFASHGNLKRHLHVHNNVYPYTCPHCQQKFRHSNTYKMHLESKHNENRPANASAYNRAHQRQQQRMAERMAADRMAADRMTADRMAVDRMTADTSNPAPTHHLNQHNPDQKPPNPYRMHMDNRLMDNKPPIPGNYHHDDSNNPASATAAAAAANNYYNNYDNYMTHRNTGAEEAVAAAMLTCLVPQWYTQM